MIDLRSDKRVKVEGTDGRAMMSVRMNTTIKPFDDVRVRQAFNFGIDQGKLVQSILLGTGGRSEVCLAADRRRLRSFVLRIRLRPGEGAARC